MSGTSSAEGEKRFDWINGFVAATLNATIESTGCRLSGLTFQGLNQTYLKSVCDRIASVSSLPPVHVTKEDLGYLFHLEGELWGADWDEYSGFFPPSITQDGPKYFLQTFLFAHAFILVERWLHTLVLPAQLRSMGRKGRRRELFGKDHGLLTVRYPDALGVLGSPYNLLASSTTLMPIEVGATGRWATLRHATVPRSLRAFYRSVTGYDHFADILEAAFKNCRTKLPSLIFGRGRRNASQRRMLRGSKASWYDVMWAYSESIRYHTMCPSRNSLLRPFYWNRSVRWSTSIFISGILCLARQAGRGSEIKSSWRRATRLNPVLADVLGGSRDDVVQ